MELSSGRTTTDVVRGVGRRSQRMGVVLDVRDEKVEEKLGYLCESVTVKRVSSHKVTIED
jgi:hypothetical protein